MKSAGLWRKGYWILTVFILSVTTCIRCNDIAAGSYSYAEIYTLPFAEKDVIKAVEAFKAKNPESIVPLENLPDGREGDTDYWYHIYFYMPKQQEIVHCWTRPISKTKTKFAFVAINSGLELGNWKQVNKDYKGKENKEVIKRLEGIFLNPIKTIIQNQDGL